MVIDRSLTAPGPCARVVALGHVLEHDARARRARGRPRASAWRRVPLRWSVIEAPYPTRRSATCAPVAGPDDRRGATGRLAPPTACTSEPRPCPRSTCAPSPATTPRSCCCPATPTARPASRRCSTAAWSSARKVNDHRALYGYTGTYQGVPVSVQTTGMGTPSFSIVVEELLRLGATRLIRVGTCGGIGRGIHTGDLVVATAAAPVDGSTRTYLHGDPFAPVADFGLTRALVDAAAAAGRDAVRGARRDRGRVLQPRRRLCQQVARPGHPGLRDGGRGAVLLAGREQGAGKDVRAACALTVSDTLSEEETSEGTYMSLEDLERATDTMIRVALEAGTAPLAMSDAAWPRLGPGHPGRRQPDHASASPARWWLESRAAGGGRRAISTAWAWDHFVSRGRLDRPAAGVLDHACRGRGDHEPCPRRQLRDQRHEPPPGGAGAHGR